VNNRMVEKRKKNYLVMVLYSQSEEGDICDIRKPFLKRVRRRGMEAEAEADTTWCIIDERTAW